MSDVEDLKQRLEVLEYAVAQLLADDAEANASEGMNAREIAAAIKARMLSLPSPLDERGEPKTSAHEDALADAALCWVCKNRQAVAVASPVAAWPDGSRVMIVDLKRRRTCGIAAVGLFPYDKLVDSIAVAECASFRLDRRAWEVKAREWGMDPDDLQADAEADR